MFEGMARGGAKAGGVDYPVRAIAFRARRGAAARSGSARFNRR